MPGIKPIDSASVHRINAGQVIVDLTSAIKELLENALDSGATSIDIRIKDYGLDSVEVSDNGSGIAETDWPSLGLKHHTSKLPDDGALGALPFVKTFGFRGEALSSLCAVCGGVTVTTATKETEPRGAVVKLGRDGAVEDCSGRVARPRGTTVTLTNLFDSIPVRRKTFERTAKRDFPKTLALLNAYALVPAASRPASGQGEGEAAKPGVKLRVEHITAGPNGKGVKRTTLLSTDGRGSLRAGVAAIWGPKALENVQDVSIDLDVDPDRMTRTVTVSSEPTTDPHLHASALLESQTQTQAFAQTQRHVPIRLTGLISSSSWGSGRPASDRQYIYLNARPIDLRPALRAINETYKSFNTHQYPLAVLDLTVPPDFVDINVSPDKRTVMLHSEARFLLALRKGLEGWWGRERGEYRVGGAREGKKELREGLGTAASQLDRKPGTGGGGVAEQEGAEEAKTQDDEEQAGGEASPAEEGDIELGDSQSDIRTTATPARSSALRRAVVSIKPTLDYTAETIISPPPGPSTPLSARQRRLAAKYPDSPISPSSPVHPSPSPSALRSVSGKRVVDRLDTSTASWSPNRKRPLRSDGEEEGAQNGEARKDDLEREAGRGMIRRARTQAEGVRQMRERLRGFASQTVRGRQVEADGGSDEAEAEDDEAESMEVDEHMAADTVRMARDGEPELGIQPNLIDTNGRDPTGPIFVDEDTDHLPEVEQPDGPVFLSGIHDEGAGPSRPLFPHHASSTDTEDLLSTSSVLRSDVRESDSRDRALGYRAEFSASFAETATKTGEVIVAFDLARLKARAAARRSRLLSSPQTDKPDAYSKLSTGQSTAAAGVQNRDFAAAEAALSRVIRKDDFRRMEVLGQFNKGFIIARLRSGPHARAPATSADHTADPKGKGKASAGPGPAPTDDLFIIDQHASDEKYNFETLQRTTVIRSQRLIRPRSLHLTAGDELLAMEHADVLRANGFEVELDEEGRPGQGERVKLSAMPVSKGVSWEVGDLEGLLHTIAEGGAADGNETGASAGHVVRTPKARAMFASRACRKSVMIGKALTKGQMKVLLEHMGEIDQPWNCPHGRPTMRHLVKLDEQGHGRAKGRGTSGEGRIDWAAWARKRERVEDE